MRLRTVVVWLWLSLLIGLPLVGQQLSLGGPAQMGQCEESTFTIVLSNDTTQTL